MLSIKNKWAYIITTYICLFIIFIATVVTSNGIVRLFSFIISLFFFVAMSGRNIKSAVLMTVAVLPNTELLSGSFAGISTLKIIILLCGIIVILQYIRIRTRHKILVPTWYYVIWIAYIAVNQIFINGGFTIQAILSIFGMMLISIALQMVSCDDKRTTEKFILMIFVGFSFIVVIAYVELLLGKTFFYSLWTGTERYRYGIMRVGSTVADPNNICFYLVPFYFWTNTEIVKNTIPYYYRKAFQVLTLIIVLLTSSRAGLISLLLGFLFCLIGKRKAFFLITLPIVGIFANYLLSAFETLMSSAAESTDFRNFIVEQCLLLWNKNKLFGVGINNIMTSLGYDASSLNTMNTFIFMLTGPGLVGLIFYVFYWTIMIKDKILLWVRNNRIKDEQLSILACVFTAIIMAYTLDTFYMMLMWIMPAMLLAVSRKQKVGD